MPTLRGKAAERMIRMLENPKPLTKKQQEFYRQAIERFEPKRFDKGYAVVYCGGHIMGQIDLKDWPIEIVKHRKKKCPECGTRVDDIGCVKHHALKMMEDKKHSDNCTCGRC